MCKLFIFVSSINDMNINISIVLDKRRIKKNQIYPVKLRVYSPLLKATKMYPTGLDMGVKKFERVWLTEKPKKIDKEERDYLDAFRVKAVEAAKKTNPFSFDIFETKLGRRKSDGKNLVYCYNNKISELKSLGRFGTAESCESSLKSIKRFLLYQKHAYSYEEQSERLNEFTNIRFNAITPLFLQKYENHMLQAGKSKTTVGIYLRALRTIFNIAIEQGEVSEDLYPFGKSKYRIPKGKANKKALSKNQISILFHSKPQTPQQQKAKDFWLFSYICNGMNIKDIALLKYKNIKGGYFEFERAKTERTVDTQTIVVVHLTDFSKHIIEKYGNKDRGPEQYIFSIVDGTLDGEIIHQRVGNFTRFVNQHIKSLAKANGLPEEITSYWARHSFATLTIQNGANLEFVKEAFGHQSITTTQTYFAGFEDKTKKDIIDNLLKFD